MLAAFIVGGLANTLTQSAATTTVEWLTFGVMVGVCPAAGNQIYPHNTVFLVIKIRC